MEIIASVIVGLGFVVGIVVADRERRYARARAEARANLRRAMRSVR